MYCSSLKSHNKVNIADWLLVISTCLYALTVGIYPHMLHYAKIILVIGILVKIILNRENIYFDKYCRNIIILMAIYCLVLFLSSVLSPYHTEGFKGAGGWLNKSILLVVVLLFINNIKHLKIIFYCFLADFFINSLYVIYDGIHYHNLRAQGIVGSYMPTATIMFFLFTISMILTIHYWRKNNYKFMVFLITFSFSFIAILFNGTRGVWLGAAVAFAMVLWQMINNKKMILGAGIVFLAVISVLYLSVPHVHNRIDSIVNSKNQSNHERFLIYNSALHIIKDYPILGIGTDNFKDAYQKHYISPQAKEPNIEHAHDLYLESFAENGIIGLCSFMTILGYIFYIVWEIWHNKKNVFALITAGLLMTVLLHGLTEYVFAHIIITNIFWILVGISLKLSIVDSSNDFLINTYK